MAIQGSGREQPKVDGTGATIYQLSGVSERDITSVTTVRWTLRVRNYLGQGSIVLKRRLLSERVAQQKTEARLRELELGLEVMRRRGRHRQP